MQGQQKAETAAGIGETDGENIRPAERDADGRCPGIGRIRREPKPAGAKTPRRPSPDPRLLPARPAACSI